MTRDMLCPICGIDVRFEPSLTCISQHGICGVCKGLRKDCNCMKSSTMAATPQPPPQAGRVDVTARVISDLNARKEFGTKKYGTPLLSHNGRDALMDAYQEALDLCCYLCQCLIEKERGDGPAGK